MFIFNPQNTKNIKLPSRKHTPSVGRDAADVKRASEKLEGLARRSSFLRPAAAKGSGDGFSDDESGPASERTPLTKSADDSGRGIMNTQA